MASYYSTMKIRHLRLRSLDQKPYKRLVGCITLNHLAHRPGNKQEKVMAGWGRGQVGSFTVPSCENRAENMEGGGKG